jgi:hypothetical protein
VAETSGLLNRRRGITPTEGSNPSVSARYPFANFRHPSRNPQKTAPVLGAFFAVDR